MEKTDLTTQDNPHLSPDVMTIYALGLLTLKEQVPVEDHLIECPSCRRYVGDVLRAQLDFYQRTYKPIPAPPDWQARLLGSLGKFYESMNDPPEA